MRTLIELILIVMYCISIFGCACIANNRNNITAAYIGLFPIVNTGYMIYRWDDCNMIEIFNGAMTNLEKDIENL